MRIKPFRYYFLLALYTHLVFLAILTISLAFRKDIISEEQVIVVDIVPIQPITNIKTVKIEKEKSIVNENAKLVKKSSDSETKEIKKPEEKKTEEKPIQKPDDKKISKKIDQKTKEKKPNKIQDKPNKNVKKEVDKTDKNQSKIKQNIKTIEKSSQGDQEKSKKQNREKTEDEKSEALGKEDIEDEELSINERQLIQSKIEENWDQAFLLGIKGIENIEISVLISLSYDGSLSKNPSIEKASCPGISASVCDAIVRSVSSAIIKSSPIIGLPIDRYEAWKEISINFRPDF